MCLGVKLCSYFVSQFVLALLSRVAEEVEVKYAQAAGIDHIYDVDRPANNTGPDIAGQFLGSDYLRLLTASTWQNGPHNWNSPRIPMSTFSPLPVRILFDYPYRAPRIACAPPSCSNIMDGTATSSTTPPLCWATAIRHQFAPKRVSTCTRSLLSFVSLFCPSLLTTPLKTAVGGRNAVFSHPGLRRCLPGH